MADDRRGGVGDGIRDGLGMLMAFKEAVEETVEEAISQSEMNSDKASAVMRDATVRLQQAVEEVRDRFEPVPRREFDALKGEVADLRARIARMESLGTDASAGGSEGESSFPVD